MKKILLLTDSLALPRETPEICDYEDTWPYLLKLSGHNVHQVSIGGATSTDLLNQIHYHKSFNPDLVIVQVGIVDCAPRFMTKTELNFIRKIPYLGSRIIKMMNNDFVRKIRNITYTTPNIFKENLIKIQKEFERTILISIVPANKEYEIILPKITRKIKQYNSIMFKNCSHVIKVDGIENNGLMSDHHHLNSQGHKFIYDSIIDFINA